MWILYLSWIVKQSSEDCSPFCGGRWRLAKYYPSTIQHKIIVFQSKDPFNSLTKSAVSQKVCVRPVNSAPYSQRHIHCNQSGGKTSYFRYASYAHQHSDNRAAKVKALARRLHNQARVWTLFSFHGFPLICMMTYIADSHWRYQTINGHIWNYVLNMYVSTM